MRDTPPSIQDGKYGWEPDSGDNFSSPGDAESGMDDKTAIKLGVECYTAASAWINSGRRAQWADSLRAFQSRHPSGSKYLSRDYTYRSTFFRPKTRAMVRKAEAQTAAAFFSNEDVVSIQPHDDDDPQQKASAEILQSLIQYRLTNTIPWFATLVGARQDCEVMGLCVGKAYWRYAERVSHQEMRPKLDESGQMTYGDDQMPITESVDVMEKTEDRPVIDLIASENFMFDPGADWRDPVATSPYVIELIPMYLADVRQRIKKGDWNDVAESALRSAVDLNSDSTRRAREQGRVPGQEDDTQRPRDFDICWVRENIIRWEGEDWHYFSVGEAGTLLTGPRLLREVHLHGERPYRVGFVVLETHKTHPSSKVELVRGLQGLANEEANARLDNVKLALNPRQFVRSGSGVDISDLRTFMPGKVVIIPAKGDEPISNTIMWDRPPDVTASSYAEQDRINLDFDELAGDFSNTSVQANQAQQQSATGMNLMSGMATGMNEYELRCFAETWVEPMLKLLIKLEQAYETDPAILTIAGNKAQLWQKYGINEITDELLNCQVTIRVNVGIGSTNPQLKLRNFMTGADALGKMYGPTVAMGTNFEEVSKEVFAMLGYKDGARFFKPDFDPRVQMLQQQLQELQDKSKAPPPADQSKVQAAQITAQSKMQERASQDATDKWQAQLEMQKTQFEAETEARMQQQQFAHEREMEVFKAQQEAARDEAERQHAMILAHSQRQFDAQREEHQAAQKTNEQQFGAQREDAGHQHMQAMAEGIKAIQTHMTKPRMIVRDENGKVAGLQ